MKLYYAPGACSLADHIALIENGLTFELEKVDLRTRTTASGEDFTKVNPKGYVPALELDDGTILTENIAVLSYITALGGATPASGIRHWRVLEALAFVSTEIHKNFKPFFAPGATDGDRAKARDILSKRFAWLDEELSHRPFVVDGAVSAADYYLFVMLLWANKVGVAVPSRLGSYLKRLERLPSFHKALVAEGLA